MHIQCIDNAGSDRCFNALYEVLNTMPSVTVTKNTIIEPNKDLYITNNSDIQILTNKPCIYFMSQNPYVSHIESFVYNKPAVTNIKCTAIWIQDVYGEYKEYLETIYKVPVHVVPFMYTLNEKASIAPSGCLDIALYDSNKTFNESVLKSLLICEEFYTKNPTLMGTVYLFNLPSNDMANKMLDSFTLWNDKKLRIFTSISETDILKYFSNSSNHCVFLSNSVVEHVTPFMYDIVNHGFPLLHTQPLFPFGIFYDKNNINDCLAKLASYKELKPPVYDNETYQKHKLEQTQAVQKLCTGFSQGNINIHERLSPSLNDVTKPVVITYDNAPSENTQFYIQTLKNNNWEYIVIGKDEKWNGWITRMTAYLHILKTLDPNKVVLLTDARDVLCLRSSASFMDAFAHFKSDMVACMELMCDNRIEIPDNYIGNQCHPITNYWKYHGMPPPIRQYVNNGLLVGKAFKLIEVLQYGIDNKFIDDQKALGSFINTYPQSVGTDINAEVFHTTCFGSHAGLFDVRMQSDDAPTFSELFGRGAFFLHIPGIMHVKGAKVVYNITKSLLEAGVSDGLLRAGYPYEEPVWVSKTTPQSLGAYYQCYKNPVSFLRTMESFQKDYPKSTIVVSNDGGDDYADYCNLMQNTVYYTYYPKTHPASEKLSYLTLEPLLIYMRRLWESFPKFKESHIILLEDDVRIIRRHTAQFKHTINGMNPAWELPEPMKQMLRDKGYRGHFYLGGCGGCVLDKEFYQRIPFTEVESLLRRVPTLSLYATDICFVFIALYYGGSINHYSEFAETFYPNIKSLLIENKVAFLHQFKQDYNKELTDGERKKLFPNV